MKKKLLSPNDSCFKIITISQDSKWQNILKNNPKLPKITKNLIFPKYSSSQIMKLKNELDNTAIPFQQTLSSNSYKFEMSPSLLVELINFYETQEEQIPIDLIAIIIFLSYLSWSMAFYSTNDFAGLSTLLNSFIFISHSYNDKNDILFVHLSISSFYHSFILFLNNNNFNEDCSYLISPLNDFFLYNSHLPDPVFGILQKVGFDLISQSNVPQSSSETAFYNILNNIFQLHMEFPSSTAIMILNRSCFGLQRLDYNVILFFSHCSSLLDDQTQLKFLTIILGAFNQLINHSPVINKIPTYSNDYLIITEEMSKRISYQSATISTFDSEPTPTRIVIPPTLEWDSLISKSNIKILNQIICILENRPTLIEKFIHYFFPFLSISIKTDHFIDFFALFCYLCEKLSNSVSVDFENKILINEIIFHPSMTVFGHLDDSISKLRRSILGFIIKFKSQSMLKQLFLNNSSYPYLYTELVHRLFDYEIDFSNKHFVATITNSLLLPMLFYQTLRKYDKSTINSARNAVLIYFSSIFELKLNLTNFFSNPHFIRLFFALLFEEPLQKTIYEYFTRFILNSHNSTNLSEINQLLIFVISSEFDDLTNKRNVQIMNFMLEIVNLVLNQFPVFAQTFSSLLPSIFNSIGFIQKAENSVTDLIPEDEISHSTQTNQFYIPLLKTILKFISKISNSRIFNLSEIYLLERSINIICGDEPDDEIAFLLINLFSRQNEIQHPSLVYLYLQTFVNSNKLINCFIKLIELCKSNLNNCICLHEGEIDLLILKYIDIWRINGTIDIQILKHALHLFELISSHISAYEIVQKYISLLCPLEGKYLPYFNIEIINQLHSLILKSTDFFLQHFLPLTDKNTITSTFSIDSPQFAFGFWLKPISNTNKRKTIVHITENDISLEIGLYGNLLVLTASNEQIKVINDLETRPPIDTWSFISFAFDSHTLSIYIDNHKIETLDYAKYQFKKSLSVIVNAEQNVQNPQNSVSLLGSFAFFTSLTKNDLNRIIRQQGPLTSNLICGFIPNVNNGKFSITNLTSIQFNSSSQKIAYPQNFVDILYNYCKIESLIPLFAQIDMKYKDGTEINYFASILLIIFQEFLTKSVEIQESFAMSSGFLIISHLLRNAANHHFTYKLLKHFYDLFDQLTVQTAKTQLFEGILFNFEIWLKSTFSEFRLILHEFTKRMKLNKGIFIQNLDFSYMIIILQTLFWYEPIETNRARCLHRSLLTFQDIKKSRHILLNLTYQIAKEKLSKNDIEVLIASATTCRDLFQIFDLIDFLILLVNTKILFFHSSLLRLLSILTLCQYDLSFKVIFLFSLFDNFDMIIDELIINYYHCLNNRNLLLKLVKINNKNINRLISSILFKFPSMSINTIRKLIMLYSKKDETDENEIWSILLLFQLKSIKIKKKLINYLVKTRPNFSKLFSQASLISMMVKDDENVLRLLVLEMLDFSNENNVNQLQSIVIHYVFFRRKSFLSKSLFEQFKESPFNNCLNESHFCNDIYDFQNVFRDFSNPMVINQQIDLFYEKFNHPLYFGLHIDEKNEWLDFDLIQKAISKQINNEVISQFVHRTGSFNNCEMLQDSFVPEKVRMKDSPSFLSVPALKSYLFNSIFTHYLKRFQIAENLWCHFWRLMTTKKAPWRASISRERKSKTHHKRDSTFCFAFCPFKTKRNFSFDSHLHASFSRDSGSIDFSKEKFKSSNSRKSSQFDLLSVDDFSEIDSPHSSRDSSQLSIIKTNKIIFEANCNHITVQDSIESNFTIFSDYISIVHLASNKMKIIELQSIELVLLRTQLHHLTAIEIFTNTRHSYFLDFLDFKNHQNVLNVLKKFLASNVIQLSNFKQYFAEQNFLDDWVNRKISNFEYLLLLNIYSGRSFNSPSQYPFVPWILCDYQSDTINLNDEKVYRDLTKAIGVVQDERLSQLISKQNELSRLKIEPFLFSSGPVCPLSVFLWLIRLEPFTSLHIEVQGGRFDHAARIFYSVRDSYRLATSHMNDFRELIPEFFYSPEFLINSDNFDLGQLSDQIVNDVELPKWSHNNPYEFVYTMRKAMESQYVSEHLNHWIDLIWGVRQKAEDNRYKSEMYDDVWENNPNVSGSQKIEIETILSQVGQMPTPLFDELHPRRIPKKSSQSLLKRSINVNPFTFQTEILSANVATLNSRHSNLKSRTFPRNTFSEDNLRNYHFSHDDLHVKFQQSESERIMTKKSQNHPMIQVSLLTSTGLIQNSILNIQSENDLSENHVGIQSKSAQIDHFDLIRKPNSILPFSHCYISPFIVNSVTKSPSIIPKEQIEKSSSETLFLIDMKKEPSILHEHNANLICVGQDRTDVYIVKENCDIDIYSNSCDVTCISSDGIYTAICGKDTVIHLFKKIEKDKRPIHSIISFYNSIVCCFVWSPFDSMVCGTKDCSLLICSLSKGEIVYDIDVRSILKQKCENIDCENEPLDNISFKMILVTPSWGFILIYSEILLKKDGKVVHIVSLLNINGNYIRSVEFNFRIACWESFSSLDGFDYVLVSDENGKLYLFEAFYLNPSKPIYRCQRTIIHVKYLLESNIVVAISKEGTIFLVPYSFV